MQIYDEDVTSMTDKYYCDLKFLKSTSEEILDFIEYILEIQSTCCKCVPDQCDMLLYNFRVNFFICALPPGRYLSIGFNYICSHSY